MRITYDISLEEFAALQPHFVAKRSSLLVYQAALGVVTIAALIRSLPLVVNLGSASGGGIPSELLFCIFLAAAASGCSYWLRRRSLAKLEQAKQSYREGVRIAYQRLHCRDQRVIESLGQRVHGLVPLWTGDPALDGTDQFLGKQFDAGVTDEERIYADLEARFLLGRADH